MMTRLEMPTNFSFYFMCYVFIGIIDWAWALLRLKRIEKRHPEEVESTINQAIELLGSKEMVKAVLLLSFAFLWLPIELYFLFPKKR